MPTPKTLSPWVVELEPGLWIAPWEGDPGRTLRIDNASRFRSRATAEAALERARRHRPLGRARLQSCAEVLP